MRRTKPDGDPARQEWLAGGTRTARAMDAFLNEPVFTPAGHAPTSELPAALRALGEALTAGTTPALALQHLATDVHHATPVGDLCTTLARQTATGTPLSAALANSGHPSLTAAAAVVAVGEQTGGTAEALAAAADLLEEETDSRALVRHAVTYPVLALAGTAGLLLVLAFAATPLLTLVAPAPLPWYTTALLTASRTVPVLLALAAVGALVARTLRRRAGVAPRRAWQLRLPGVRDVVAAQATAQAATVAGRLLASGASAPAALEAAARAVTHPLVRDQLLAAVKDVREDGLAVVDALNKQPHLTGPLARAFQHGQATGDTAHALGVLATSARERARTRAAALAEAAEPATGAVFALVLLTWLAGIALPVLIAAAR